MMSLNSYVLVAGIVSTILSEFQAFWHVPLSCVLVTGAHICEKQARSYTQREEEKFACYKARNKPN